MAFQLRVEFAGLCIYLIDQDSGQVAVLMPDCRGLTAGSLEHVDGTIGRQHVGYLRLDLANLGVAVPPGVADPRYEVIHRLDRRALAFEFAGASPGRRVDQAERMALPNSREFASLVRPITGLLAAAPPEALLFRTVLSGGQLTGEALGKTWVVPALLHETKREYRGTFAGFVTWTQQIEADNLTLVLSDFGGSNTTRIALRPVSVGGVDVVALKVANLCAHNPLEWDEFPPRQADADRDFKWLWRLLEPSSGESYRQALAGAELPFPRTAPGEPMTQGNEPCIGFKVEASFRSATSA